VQIGYTAPPTAQMPAYPQAPSMYAAPGSMQPDSDKPHFEAELEINDFPQHARWKVRSFFCSVLALHCGRIHLCLTMMYDSGHAVDADRVMVCKRDSAMCTELVQFFRAQ
jgi:hypothetical protein